MKRIEKRGDVLNNNADGVTRNKSRNQDAEEEVEAAGEAAEEGEVEAEEREAEAEVEEGEEEAEELGFDESAIHQVQNTYKTLYELGPEFGKRVWTDFFETQLPRKLMYPQFKEKTIKSMMFDPEFITYHTMVSDKLHAAVENMEDMELMESILREMGFTCFPHIFKEKDFEGLMESFLKVMRNFLSEMFMNAEASWLRLMKRICRCWKEGLFAARAAKIEEERRRLLYPNINKDELMLGCEIRLVQRAFKVATEEPHKFGITLMKNMFEMFPLLIDRFELFNSLPLHEIVAKPEFRRYGMAATYAVVPVVGSIHDDIACILECEKWVKGFVYPNKLTDEDVCNFKDAFIKSISEWINFPIGDAFPFAERCFEKIGDLIMEICSTALRELKKLEGDHPPEPPTHRELTEWEKRNLRRIVAEDIIENQAGSPDLLSQIVIKYITENFGFFAAQQINISDKFILDILNRLPIDLPLEVTTDHVTYEDYWKRKSQVLWPLCDPDQHSGSYKTLFFERTLQEKIENYVPHAVDHLEKLADLEEFMVHCKDVVKKLKICQLFRSEYVPPVDELDNYQMEPKPKDDSDEEIEAERSSEDILEFFKSLHGARMDHIDFATIFSCLPNLETLDLCYRVHYVVDNFEWRLFEFTPSDCTHLAAAFAFSSMKNLKIANSGVKCDKLRVLAAGLRGRPTLESLDLSHNCIRAEGMRSLWMILKHPDCNLESLNLYDNELREKGALNLARALEKYPGHLQHLNLRLNQIGDVGAAAILNALLPIPEGMVWPEWKPAKPLALIRTLNLASNDLTVDCMEDILQLMQRTKTLKDFDLSCNPFARRPPSAQPSKEEGHKSEEMVTISESMDPSSLFQVPSLNLDVDADSATSVPFGSVGLLPVPVQIVDALDVNDSLRILDLRLCGFDGGLQEIVDETLEGRKDDDKNQIQDEEKEKRLETILESVKDKMDKQFPHLVEKEEVRYSDL